MPEYRNTVVLPTYCEAENLPTLLPAILESAPVNVLVVDDGSEDGTAELAESIGAGTKRVSVIRRGRKLGLGSAYRTGIRAALESGAEIVVTMDADWSHDPAYLRPLIAAASVGQLAIGSRYVEGGGIRNWPLSRLALSRGACIMARLILGAVASDITSGFRAYPRFALELVSPETIRSEGYSFLVEMATRIYQQGIPIVEVPIIFEDRRGGVSKISQREIYRAIVTLAKLGLHL
jgi:dolichol-phosphate mannosyltransferase